MKKLLVRHFVLLSALATAGCGSKDDKTERTELKRPASSGDLTQELDCNGSTSAALTDYRLRQIPAEELAVEVDGAPKSLCDVMRGTGAALNFVTFVSSSCYGCMIWAEELSLDLAGTDIHLTVVVTDKADSLSDEDIGQLTTDIAPEATWVRDGYGELWSFFGTSERTTPLLVVMDDFAQGFYVDGDETTAEVVAEANRRMGFDFVLP